MYYGWVKLHRRFLDWEWYDDPNTLRVFLHCLLKANHKDKKYRGDLIKRSTFVTSLEVLSFELNLSIQKIRTALHKLEKTGEINRITNRKGTVISICNYDSYQKEDQENNKQNNTQVTDEQHTSNIQVTTTKNENNEKILKNENIYTFLQFWEDYDKRVGVRETQDAYLLISDEDKLLIKQFIPIYKAYQPNNRWRKSPVKFLASEIWKEDWKNYQPKFKKNESSSDFYADLESIEHLKQI